MKKDNKINIEEKYKTLTEASPDCIKLFDINGKLLYINPGGLEEHKIKNLKKALEEDWRIIESIRDKDKKKFATALEKAAREGKTSTIEIEHKKEFSNREFCLETIAPIKNKKGEITGIFGVSRDITQIKKTEQELKKIKNNLELEIKERTFELETKLDEFKKINKIMVGRELKMVQLKEEIEKLKEEIKTTKKSK